jgi:hypothetical protein
MRARWLFNSTLLVVCCASAAPEESPHDLAVRIISSRSAPVYQPKDTTDEERKKEARFNAGSELHEFILSDSVPDEIKVCYAMHVLVDRLILARDLSNSNLAKAYKEDLDRSYDRLADYLHTLNQQKLNPSPTQ